MNRRPILLSGSGSILSAAPRTSCSISLPPHVPFLNPGEAVQRAHGGMAFARNGDPRQEFDFPKLIHRENAPLYRERLFGGAGESISAFFPCAATVVAPTTTSASTAYLIT
ncbi:hypothetical protein KDW69_21050 [Burkholderia ambifaria]|uniref:hypothetical protein n=1 Tax=Burkholderia ambifaria TaxID=152480 RepID=UPI001B91EEA0|nr:hypothetical protein [Burkholderia ambifaria]MBR8334145.1 hypothetical protein [Burkholderia ambifaria]